MYGNKELCEKIKSIYADIGECGIDIKVEYDKEKKAYAVDLQKGEHRLKTYLEPEDADLCMQGKQCVGLGFQISQLVANIKKL